MRQILFFLKVLVMDYLKSKNSSSSQDAQTQIEKPVKSLNHWDFSFFYLTLLMGMLTLIFIGFLQAFNFLFHLQHHIITLPQLYHKPRT